MSTRSVAVLGLGLIGGSIAARLSEKGYRVTGYDVDPLVRTNAMTMGVVASCADNLGEALRGADSIVLATPISVTMDILPMVDALAPPEAQVFDTASVKTPILDIMNELPGAARAIGGHPMAGSERSGISAARPDLFEGSIYVLVPSSTATSSALGRVQALVGELGANQVIMTAQEHDETVANTSHLPQLVSTAIALSIGASDRRLTGPGLRDMTRLAASPNDMWLEIFIENRINVVSAAESYLGILRRIVDILRQEPESLGQTLVSARESAQLIREVV